MIYKKLLLVPLITFITSFTFADSINVKRDFEIFAKIPFLPKVNIMDINTSLYLSNDEYEYEFNIKSKKIVNFINQIDGKGFVTGKIKDAYIPKNYTYEYLRKNKKKFVRLDYDKEKIKKIIVKPDFDKSKLTPVSDEMLYNTIDPSTFFLSVLDFKKTNKCNKTFRIFDGKRRYDVKFENMHINKENSLIECEASQIKLGGYKENESDVFAASDFIQVVYAIKTNEFLRYEAKNGNIKISINEIRK